MGFLSRVLRFVGRLLLRVFAVFAVWQIVVRLVRRYWKFPAPAFIAMFLNSSLLDPDYPWPKTVIKWCEDAGYQLVSHDGSLLHYVLTFAPLES